MIESTPRRITIRIAIYILLTCVCVCDIFFFDFNSDTIFKSLRGPSASRRNRSGFFSYYPSFEIRSQTKSDVIAAIGF